MISGSRKKIILATAPEYFMEVWYSAPLGLAYIASHLEKAGYDVEIVDSHLNRYSIRQAARAIVSKKPDAVGLTASSDNRFKAIELSREIRALDPDVFIFAGGPHFSATAEDAISNVPHIDAVVRGEGEFSAVELLDSHFSGKNLNDIMGICFRENGRAVSTARRPAIDDLDALEMPAYHLLELKKYNPLPSYFTNLTEEEKRLPAAGVVTSRGCPNSCIFCANNSENMKTVFRKRAPAKIVDEIDFLNKKYGVRVLNIWDDTFTISKKHVLDVCGEILSRGLCVKWYARARVDSVDKEMLVAMKKAGCIALLYGAESGSEKILKVINKNISVEMIRRAVRYAVEARIDIMVAFMISFPGEEKEDVLATLDLARELRSYGNNVYAIDLSPTVIYPGTIIEKIALDEGGIIPRGFSWNKRHEFRKNSQLLVVPSLPIYTQKFSLEEIMAFRLINKSRQNSDQPKVNLVQKAIRLARSIKGLRDIKMLVSIFNSLLRLRLEGIR